MWVVIFQILQTVIYYIMLNMTFTKLSDANAIYKVRLGFMYLEGFSGLVAVFGLLSEFARKKFKKKEEPVKVMEGYYMVKK